MMISALGKRKEREEATDQTAGTEGGFVVPGEDEKQKLEEGKKPQKSVSDKLMTRAKRRRLKKQGKNPDYVKKVVVDEAQKEKEMFEAQKERAEAAKEYIRLWRAKDPNWKFKKVAQANLLQSMFDPKLVSNEFDVTHGLIS
eukprot:TRINITY_DN4227_c0_g1_i3.p2 TRINITY_DN4227_c0_g1~~TRINITY_DN4227_c0_g1_i3.p2  ORF type:complete len:142 (-),score=48.22 TRINITY_DN4227_c0_g1_i3:9-434(-)